jgi:DNA topoisomerase VI subunit B
MAGPGAGVGDAGLCIMANDLLLREALQNVLDNAVEYAGAGCEITVQLERRGNDAVVKVIDTGPGVPEALHERVLERFVRATDKGLGCGLKDFTVVGGGGNGMATALLTSRVRQGNPPSVAQIRTPSITKWAQEGKLANIDAVAKAENWDALLPAPVRNAVQYQGRYVAVPVNVHRLNW